MKLILASNNKNKLREFREILEPMGFDVISQSEAGANIEVEETGTTFEENAYLKAKAIYDMFHLPVISDDSGLEVDALNGAPGIYSARYAEEGKRCARVLSELENVPDDKRTARFRCCICYIDENGNKNIVSGACENFAADCVKNPCRAKARLRIFAYSATKLCSKIRTHFL